MKYTWQIVDYDGYRRSSETEMPDNFFELCYTFQFGWMVA